MRNSPKGITTLVMSTLVMSLAVVVAATQVPMITAIAQNMTTTGSGAVQNQTEMTSSTATNFTVQKTATSTVDALPGHEGHQAVIALPQRTDGIIFDFYLSEDRTQLSFDNNGPLKDKVADNAQELKGIIFGHGFGGITDIKIGSYDGYMYVLSLDRGGDECKPQYPNRSCIPYSSTEEGHIFRIVPDSN